MLGLLFVFGGVLFPGPDLDHRRFRLITPGAVLAVTVWVIASAGLAIYADRFGGYNKVWGSLAAVIVTMTWLWLSSPASRHENPGSPVGTPVAPAVRYARASARSVSP